MAYYVCNELIQESNAVSCKSWVTMPEPVIVQSSNALDSLALSKDGAVMVGNAILGCLGVIIAFVIIAKASKML